MGFTARRSRNNIESIHQRVLQRSIKMADERTKRDINIWMRETDKNWPVDTGYSRASITIPERIEPGYWQFRITAKYAGVIEYGLYPGVGPKTSEEGPASFGNGVEVSKRIFPTQKPYAPLRRAKAKVIENRPLGLINRGR